MSQFLTTRFGEAPERQKATGAEPAPVHQIEPQTALLLARAVSRRTTAARPLQKKKGAKLRRKIVAAIEDLEEVKFIDVISGFQQIDKSGVVDTTFCSIPQGPSQSNRVGDRIVVKRFTFRYSAYLNMTAALTALNTHSFRVIIYQWMLSTSVLAPTVGNILTAGASAAAVVSPFNWQGLKQNDFVVLYDKAHSVGAYDDAKNVTVVLDGHWPVQFDTSAVSGEGKIGILLIGDDATGAHAPDVQLQYYGRIEYIDA